MDKKILFLGVIVAFIFIGGGCSKTKTDSVTQPDTKINLPEQQNENINNESVKNTTTQSPKAPAPIVKPEDTKKVTCALGDMECFQKGLVDCTLINTPFSFIGPVFIVTTISEGNNCRIRHTADKGFEEEFSKFKGTSFDCVFAKNKTETEYLDIWTDTKYFLAHCNGSYVEVMKDWSKENDAPLE